MSRTQTTLAALAGAAAGAVAYRRLLRPRLRRWGSHAGEARRPQPGDALIEDPETVTTRAVTIDAPPADVWPWIVQMGQQRGGFYSYDRLERLAGLDIHNTDRIHPEWQTLVVGDKVYLSPSASMIVAEVDPERALVLFQEATLGGGFEETFRWSWSFVLRPVGEARTRLLVRTRVSGQPFGVLTAVLAAPIEGLHFLMERGMLHGLKRRAETSDRAVRTEERKP